jgi:hypothetical protein
VWSEFGVVRGQRDFDSLQDRGVARQAIPSPGQENCIRRVQRLDLVEPL